MTIHLTAMTRDSNKDILWTHRARTDDPETAVARAVQKHYGKAAQFIRNHELSLPKYWIGQVFKPVDTGGMTSVTKTFIIDFE